MSSSPLSSQNSVDDPTNLLAEVSRLKRRIEDLQDIRSPVSHKRPTSTAKLGRGIRRIVTLFQSLPALVHEADRRDELADSSDENEENEEDPIMLARSRDRTYGAWKELIKLIPSIKTSIVNLDPHALGTYYSMLMKGASDARSDDIRNIKIGVASWLNKYPSTRPPLNPEDRLSRGFQHDTTGRLLCPVEFDWNDMEVRAKLRACEDGFDPSSSFFIRCLYPSNTADPNDVENGFLRGSLLVKTFSTIFTSPSSAQHIKDDHNDDTENFPSLTRHTLFKSPKSNIATKLQLENVTPRAIAYSAVLLHFSLTDAPSWKATYNGFSYEDFYNFVIDYFEDTPTVVAKDNSHALLKWWNKQIFPGRSKANKNTHSSRCRLEEQRAARAMALNR